jgi:hypothetical protein
MKKINLIFSLLLLLVFASSCNDNFLNTKPQSEFMADRIWIESSLAEAYMFDIYFTFQDAGFTEELQASATDEAMFTHGRDFVQTNAGAVTDVNVGWFGETQSGHQWARLYTNIRSCNDFIENVDNATFDQSYKTQLKGEAYFLRAYFFHRLTRGYGGVPLQLKVTELTDPDFMLPRSSYNDCIDQILSDLGNAAELLKDRTFANTQKGRATLAAVLALKARVLTDAASDLHDEATATAKVPIFASYANKELLFYTKGTRTDRWQAAKDAAKALMDNPMGHGLSTYGGTGLSTEEKAQAIWEFFTKESEENIFSRYFISTKDESGTKMPLFNGPSGYHGWGGNTPVQDMVDAYAMEDGSKFDWNNPAEKAFPYKNREPRFYASILYDGMQWMPRPDDYATSDPTGTIETGYYQTDPAQDKSKYWPGMDTRTGAGENWNGTYTGYYLKKFINPADGDVRNRINALFPFIRYSEVVADYIEACIGLNELDEAKKYLNMFRERVNLPDVTTNNKDELTQIFQNECRLEFFFEEHRYWDIRRWMIGHDCPGINSLNGIEVVATLKPGVGAQARYEHDETRWNYTYTVIPLTNEGRIFLDKCYYLPILRDELNRNTALIQNPGYSSN